MKQDKEISTLVQRLVSLRFKRMDDIEQINERLSDLSIKKTGRHVKCNYDTICSVVDSFLDGYKKIETLGLETRKEERYRRDKVKSQLGYYLYEKVGAKVDKKQKIRLVELLRDKILKVLPGMDIGVEFGVITRKIEQGKLKTKPKEEKPPKPCRIKTYEQAMHWTNQFLEDKKYITSLKYGLKAMTFSFIKDREDKIEAYLTNVIGNIFKEDLNFVVAYTHDIFKELKDFSQKNKSEKYAGKIRQFIGWYVDELEKNYEDKETRHKILKGIKVYFPTERRVRRSTKSIEESYDEDKVEDEVKPIVKKKKKIFKLDSLEIYSTGTLVYEICRLSSVQAIARKKIAYELTERTCFSGEFSPVVSRNILEWMLSSTNALGLHMSIETYLSNLGSSLPNEARESIPSIKLNNSKTVRNVLNERFPGIELDRMLQIGAYATTG